MISSTENGPGAFENRSVIGGISGMVTRKLSPQRCVGRSSRIHSWTSLLNTIHDTRSFSPWEQRADVEIEDRPNGDVLRAPARVLSQRGCPRCRQRMTGRRRAMPSDPTRARRELTESRAVMRTLTSRATGPNTTGRTRNFDQHCSSLT